MARLIYAFLALSLGTLVAGFLIRDSSIPLLVSIGLSALVLLLILVGTSRRLRRAVALEDEQEELASLEIVEIDESDVITPDATVEVQTRRGAAKPRPPRRRRTTVADDTQAMEAVEHADAIDEPDETEVVAAPKRSRRKAAAKPRSPRQRPGTIVEPALEADSFPEFAVQDDITSAEETAADAEPPLTIDAPPPREPARRRRKAAPATAAPPAGADAASNAGTERTAAIERPVLSPKVWVIPGRSRYHTQDCRFAKGDTLREVTEATAQRRGYVACTVCKPGTA